MARPLIGVLALQGAFVEHIAKLRQLGADCIELRQLSDVRDNRLDGLVLPGGESTVQEKLLRELDMRGPLRDLIIGGLPVLATCAGAILLAREVEDQADGAGREDGGEQLEVRPPDSVGTAEHRRSGCFGTLDIRIVRNAYGRQLGSFHTEVDLRDLGHVPATFIRAPWIADVDDDVEVLAVVDDHIVAVRQGNQLALSFHPELDASDAVHRCFLEAVTRRSC